MSPKPFKPKKSKFIYIALLCSLLLHLGLVATPLLRAPAPEPEPLKPVSITLNEYQLAPSQPEAVAAPTPVPATKPAAKPTLMSKPKTQEPSEHKPQTVAEPEPEAQSEPDATPASEPESQPEPQADTPQPDNNDNPADAPEAEPTQAQPQLSPGPKLSEKDIALNGNLIQPKGGSKPSFPKVAKLRYEGPWGVDGTMVFQQGGNKYSIKTTFNVPTRPIVFESTGVIEGTFFKPLRYSDSRKGKVYAQAIFDYDNGEIHYGKGAEPDKIEPLTHKAQDYFTLVWQMALNGGKLSEPMQLTNGKKVYTHKDFSPKGDRQYDTNEGKINVQVFRINKGEDSIEFAFAPDFANIPAQIILNDDGKVHQLRLIGINLDGVDYWQAMRRSGSRKKNRDW